MFRGTVRTVVPLGAAALSLALVGPAAAAPSSVVMQDAVLQPDKSSVQLTVEVTCTAPAEATSYLSTTLWQSYYLRKNYVEGQGQTQVSCDGQPHTYSFTATTTIFFADKRFHPGRAMTESGLQYCIQTDPETTVCTGIGELIRQSIRIHR